MCARLPNCCRYSHSALCSAGFPCRGEQTGARTLSPGSSRPEHRHFHRAAAASRHPPNPVHLSGGTEIELLFHLRNVVSELLRVINNYVHSDENICNISVIIQHFKPTPKHRFLLHFFQQILGLLLVNYRGKWTRFLHYFIFFLTVGLSQCWEDKIRYQCVSVHVNIISVSLSFQKGSLNDLVRCFHTTEKGKQRQLGWPFFLSSSF